MTQSRATYWAWVENQRAHKASEELEKARNDETAAHNRIMEQQNAEANAELIRAHKEAEANARAATQQAEEASKRSYDASLKKTAADERVARMQVVSSNKQKSEDRALSERIALMNNDIQQGNLDVSKQLADNTVQRTEAEREKWAAEIENNQKNYDIKFKEYLLDLEDLARRQEDSKAMRDLNNAKFRWQKAQDRFYRGLELWKDFKSGFNDTFNNARTLTGIGKDIADIATKLNPVKVNN